MTTMILCFLCAPKTAGLEKCGPTIWRIWAILKFSRHMSAPRIRKKHRRITSETEADDFYEKTSYGMNCDTFTSGPNDTNYWGGYVRMGSSGDNWLLFQNVRLIYCGFMTAALHWAVFLIWEVFTPVTVMGVQEI
ncbi:MAG: hypothetical protein V8T87_14190 [Victivallales bacterium]